MESMSDKKQKGQQAPVEDLNEMMKVRREKMEEFRAMGVPPFGHRYDVTDYAEPIKEKYAHLEGDEEGGEVRIAGRLMAIRGHGKASFCTLNDRTGNIQVYFKIDVLGEDKYKNQFKKLDIGDIVGIRGIVFKTHRGEVTVRVEDFDLLSKSLRPLPEKFHGLQDVDIRYRQRYLDLIMNPEVRETSATLNKKMAQAYANGLIPIYCVGENLDEREAGKHFDVVKAQIEEVVYNLTEEQYKNLVIAYEPVWAIGTGKTASAEQAQEIHAYIRQVLAAKFGAAAQETAILYGGSCKPSNAAEIFAKEDVDGGLIGGAALKAEDFLAIGKGFSK